MQIRANKKYSPRLYYVLKRTSQILRRIIGGRRVTMWKFQRRMGFRGNFDQPKTFSEKINWVKYNYYDPRYETLSDKYDVRAWVTQEIGAEYLPEVYGIYDSAEEFAAAFSSLPNQFVAKPTHGTGCVILCEDKSDFDVKKAASVLKIYLKLSIYKSTEEWQYKNLKPRIICEQMLDNNIVDYKFYCFGGKPEYVHVISNRAGGETHEAFYDMDWNLAPFHKIHYKVGDDALSVPENFERMKQIAAQLSRDFSFVRVDLYNVSGRIYFSEMTFTPANGLTAFEPSEWDRKLGNLFRLPQAEPKTV